MTHNAIKLRKSNIIFVTALSLLFSAVTLAIELPFLILFVSGYRSWDTAGWMVPISVVWGIIWGNSIILNTLALIRVSTFLRSMRQSVSPEMHSLLVRIQIAAANFIVASAGTFVALAVLPVPAARRFYDDPRSYLDSDDLAVRSARIFLAYAGGIAVWFVAGPIVQLEAKVNISETEFKAKWIGQEDSSIRNGQLGEDSKGGVDTSKEDGAMTVV